MAKQAFSLPKLKFIPELDKDFIPAVMAFDAFEKAVRDSKRVQPVKIALERTATSVSVFDTVVFAQPSAEEFAAGLRHVERLIKSLLWVRGGRKITVSGDDALCKELAKVYSASGERAFDFKIMGRIYSGTVEVVPSNLDNAPAAKESSQPLGRHLDGCRIGFDLGGSDRKCAALIDGKVVFSEEIAWDPYFQKDPEWHKAGINDTLKRAAAKLPRVDAIGGSAAGVYVESRIRTASLFRGIPEEKFESHVRDIFLDLRKEWGNIPFDVVNDGEVTALAGSMELNANSVLGVSMGTSMAGGYVNPDGNITDWLNELAFVPMDYDVNAAADEWSGDKGCGVQYFSQQGVGRLAAKAGIELPADMPLPKKLVEVQKLMEAGDARAKKVFESIGVCFGYTIGWYAKFYQIEKILILGRVTSGKGGDIIIAKAKEVLEGEFPALSKKIQFAIPDEKGRRHGQAVAAASLPAIAKK